MLFNVRRFNIELTKAMIGWCDYSGAVRSDFDIFDFQSPNFFVALVSWHFC